MGWFKVDDQLAFHSKVMMAGNSAMGLWVRAGSWSAAQLTGGFLPSHMANAMANMANGMANGCDTDALVMAGLWHEVEGGYQFHDWDLFQPDAGAEKAKREELAKARSDAGKAGAAARWNKNDDGKQHGKRNGKTPEPHGKDMASEWQTDAPDPTRPDPVAKATETPPRRFAEFWEAYPRKMGKKAAQTKYAAATKRASEDIIISGAHQLASDPNLPEQKFIPHPATWLNRDGWEDEPQPATSGTPSEKRLATSFELVQRARARGQQSHAFPTQEIER